jgi:hypothetical protein
MRRPFIAVIWIWVFAVGVTASAVSAAPLQISKTPSLISDPINLLAPKAIPGAVIDYNILVKNPNAAIIAGGVKITDTINDIAIPQGAAYYVNSLAGSGPVEFSDGNILGLLGSGLTYTYTSLSSTTDSIAFSNNGGTTYTYTPVPDANGYDANVTNIQVTLSGSFAILSAFNLRLRVHVK